MPELFDQLPGPGRSHGRGPPRVRRGGGRASFHICGTPAHTGFPDAGEGACCFGAAVNGPEYCSCWIPVYESDQEKPDEKASPASRSEPCGDCAYRPDSPESCGSEDVDGTLQLLQRIVENGSPFWCHEGIRRPLRWEHPSGVVVEGSAADYRPPIVAGVPYKADGQPADVCAGWVARRAAHLRHMATADG